MRRAGAQMLRMLDGHMMGENRVHFIEATERMIAQARRSNERSQMQLI